MSRRVWWAGIALVSAGAVGAALWAQHGLGMQPCPWCILQRLILCLIALLALIGALLPRIGRGMGAMVLVLSLCGGAAALYQNLVASRSTSCNLTLADRIVNGLGLDALWPAVFEVRASCAEAAVRVLGVPFELWALLLFVALGASGVYAALHRRSK